MAYSSSAPVSTYMHRLGSADPHLMEGVFKQDFSPSLSDSKETDLLYLISDGGFYLPDKCQKYYSPSTITLAPQPTFPPPSPPPLPPLWIANSGAPSETSAIPQLSVKLWYRRELRAFLNPKGKTITGKWLGLAVKKTLLEFHKTKGAHLNISPY